MVATMALHGLPTAGGNPLCFGAGNASLGSGSNEHQISNQWDWGA
jgi:hypothetical protein